METFKEQLRKKVLDLKPEAVGFYSELFNLVAVMIKLNPDAFTDTTASLLSRKMRQIYQTPMREMPVILPELEKLYFSYNSDPHVRIRSKLKISMADVKIALDRVRQDLLFFLALVEDRPKDYDIVLEKAARVDRKE